MSEEFADIDELNISGRTENRAVAMQYIYMCQMTSRPHSPEYLSEFFASKSRDRSFYGFAEELIAGVFENLSQIDEEISNVAQNWTLDRIGRVDLAILRVAVFELLFRKDIPTAVSINEAIDLSKMFSGVESKRFINGVLDKVKQHAPLKTPVARRSNHGRHSEKHGKSE